MLNSRPPTPFPPLGAAYAILGLLLAAALVAGQELGRPVSDFLRDPTAVVDAPSYVGALSNVGVLGWAAAANAAALAWIVLGRPSWSPLFWGALLTAALLADDLFLLHESYLPQLGIPERVTPFVYGLAAIAYVVVFRDFLRRHGAALLPLALALLGASAAVDVIAGHEWGYALEDTLKLFGIATWAVFFVRASLAELRGDATGRP